MTKGLLATGLRCAAVRAVAPAPTSGIQLGAEIGVEGIERPATAATRSPPSDRFMTRAHLAQNTGWFHPGEKPMTLRRTGGVQTTDPRPGRPSPVTARRCQVGDESRR